MSEDMVFVYGVIDGFDKDDHLIADLYGVVDPEPKKEKKMTISQKEIDALLTDPNKKKKCVKRKRLPYLGLQEMLWELTARCNNNCEYCGSKDIINKDELKKEEYELIVNNILNYPPEEITLTGGEPAICEHFDWVVEKLSKKMRVKVVTNGTVFGAPKNILKKLDRIGLSINTEKEIKKRIKDKDLVLRDYKNKITMITNFGTHNIFLFDKLFKVFKDNFDCWQVQLTMGDPYQLPPEGIKYLRDKLKERGSLIGAIISAGNKTEIVLADNLQYEHICTAGVRSCSITFDGEVIPCLSERSWIDKNRSQGSLLEKVLEPEKNLKRIWETQFKEQRFCCPQSCRDCIEYPEESDVEFVVKNIEDKSGTITYPGDFDKDTVVVYGVWPGQTTIYGVSAGEVTAYAVINPRTTMRFVYGVSSGTNITSSSNVVYGDKKSWEKNGKTDTDNKDNKDKKEK